MKERIVIKDEFWVKHFQEREKEFYEEDLCSGGNPEEWWHYEKEQVPETFEELNELCKDIEVDLKLTKDGKIYCYEHLIAQNRTPAQMWAIIKNLVGDM
jgi:hypothetical protein